METEDKANRRTCFLNECVVLLFNMHLYLIQALSLILYRKPHYYSVDRCLSCVDFLSLLVQVSLWGHMYSSTLGLVDEGSEGGKREGKQNVGRGRKVS